MNAQQKEDLERVSRMRETARLLARINTLASTLKLTHSQRQLLLAKLRTEQGRDELRALLNF